MNQQQAWEYEYRVLRGIPTSTRMTPSPGATRLIDYLSRHHIELGKRALDLGCGAGRNAIYLAKQGYSVTALDFSAAALELLHENLKSQAMNGLVTALSADLTKSLPFRASSFDVIIDITITTSLTHQEMEALEPELQRVLIPGGLFASYIISQEDGYSLAINPDKALYEIPESGIIDHPWNGLDLVKLYRHWDILEMILTEKTDFIHDQNYTRRIWWLLVQKPS